MISSLSDDLLVRILDLLPDARDVVRTDALSRRWHGVWTGVTALRFDFYSRPKKFAPGAAERYLSFVNDVLALRATASESSVVEDLAISFDIFSQEIGQLVPLSVEAAQGWIRYAAQQEVKSFILKLKLPWRWQRHMYRITEGGDDNNNSHPVMTLDETDSYGKMETMHLKLDHAELRLPSSAVVLASLTELSLEDIKLPADGGCLLSRLVSSACCPRLHKLRLVSFKLSMKEKLLIEAATLLELLLERMYGVQFLELRTPSLRVLHVEKCSELNEFTVLAPRLEDLMFWVRQPLHIDDVHGHLSSVGTLKIQLFSHGIASYDINSGSIHLVQCCRLTRCLEVSFRVVETKYQTVDRIKGRIPPLPLVTSLSVCIKLRERHSSGPSVACLLAQCSNIKYLSLQLCYSILSKKNNPELDLLCDYKCHWKSNDFSLAHLQEVEFKDLIGTNCEFQFIQSILTGATGIQKVTISFYRYYCREGKAHAFKVMPPLDGGSWTTCIDTSSSYKWRSEDLVYEWTRE